MTSAEEYIVVVTAAAPFRDNERNPTQDVKIKIPDRIERDGQIPIKVIKFPFDFRNVITDMDIIPKLWNQEKKVYDESSSQNEKIYIDAILHMGMTFGGNWQVEKRARRDGYDWVGDDDKPLPKHNGGEGDRWEGLPEELRPAFDVDQIVERLQKDYPGLPTKTSTDAQLKYCEFILYESLATLHKRNETKRAVFFHHPAEKAEEQDIEDSSKLAVSVITSMIDQLQES